MKNKIKVRDKEFGIFIKADAIDQSVSRIADQINADMKG